MVEPIEETTTRTGAAPRETAEASAIARLIEPVARLNPTTRVALVVWGVLLASVVALAHEVVAEAAKLPLDQFALAVLLVVPPIGMAIFLRHRMPRVALALIIMGTLKILALSATASTALVTMWGEPLIDSQLASMDRALGFDGLAWIAWAQQPVIDHLFWLIYQTTAPQTLLVAALLAHYRRALLAWSFSLQLLIAVGLTLFVFALYPSIGPFSTPSAALTDAQRSYIDLFLGLRSGEDRTMHLFVLTGLVTFPSFHAAWAVVLTAAFRPFPKLFPVAAALNCVILLTAVTHGCHYLMDVIVGVGIGLMAVLAAQPIVALLCAPGNDGSAPTGVAYD